MAAISAAHSRYRRENITLSVVLGSIGQLCRQALYLPTLSAGLLCALTDSWKRKVTLCDIYWAKLPNLRLRKTQMEKARRKVAKNRLQTWFKTFFAYENFKFKDILFVKSRWPKRHLGRTKLPPWSNGLGQLSENNFGHAQTPNTLLRRQVLNLCVGQDDE